MNTTEEENQRLRSNLNLVRRQRDAYIAERDEAHAAVDRVRMLHSKRPVSPGCTTCNEPWPCSTIRALDQEAFL
ncbi:hypothetical protein [Gordonia malaquae]|uniref:hypothetical protein n=1 Tax=Gordonia malaquae TaxID=410332 RepID=UPI003016D163